jgi:signal transduction histidine kinase
VPLRAEPVELGELGRAVAAEFERRAQQRGVELRAQPAAGPCWAQGDPGAIARIARILLDNAVGVAPPGTAVTLASWRSDGEARLSVSDAGPGVPAAERERIFERFQRGSTSGGRSGFGLGLAIGRELAARMGGSLSLLEPTEENGRADRLAPGPARPGAEVERPGGACFLIRLPGASAEDTAAA